MKFRGPNAHPDRPESSGRKGLGAGGDGEAAQAEFPGAGLA